MAALVLVLFPPCGLHHDPAGDGNGLGYDFVLFPQAIVRIPADGLLDHVDRRAGVYRLGPSHVHLRDESYVGDELYGFNDVDRASQWRESFQLDWNALGWPVAFDDFDVV